MMGIDKFNSQRVFERNPNVSEFKIEVEKAIKKKTQQQQQKQINRPEKLRTFHLFSSIKFFLVGCSGR